MKKRERYSFIRGFLRQRRETMLPHFDAKSHY